MPLKITNPKIGPALVLELEDEPAYQSAKAFSATHAFLRIVSLFTQNQVFATLPAKLIQEWFDNYGIKYKACLDALVRHGIIEIDRHYIVKAKTRGYRLTDKGVRLMSDGELRYLRSVFSDAKLKRQLQKRTSYYKKDGKTYSKQFLQYIHVGRINYLYEEEAVNFIEDSDWPAATKLDALMSLSDFAERNFIKLKHNEADHRVWNEFVGMKSELRKLFKFKKLKYRYVMDIRSCHPLFLAHYLVHHAKNRGWQAHHPFELGSHKKTIAELMYPSKSKVGKRERSESCSITNTTAISLPSTTSPFPRDSGNTNTITNPVSHYVGGNSDILAELGRWNTLFSDPTTDPKAVLIKDLEYTRDQAKAALNQTINGGKSYRKFIGWFQKNFPLLFDVWSRTDKRTVGNEISSRYETRLMQDMLLYNLATALGLHLTYEFDGCGVMCRPDDAEVLAKIQRLINHIQAHGERLWGIRPVLVVKTAAGNPVQIRP